MVASPSNKPQQLTNTNDIASNVTAIGTKHPIINSGNKLNVSYLGNGDVDNAKLSSLNDVRTDVSVQHQLNEMKTELLSEH